MRLFKFFEQPMKKREQEFSDLVQNIRVNATAIEGIFLDISKIYDTLFAITLAAGPGAIAASTSANNSRAFIALFLGGLFFIMALLFIRPIQTTLSLWINKKYEFEEKIVNDLREINKLKVSGKPQPVQKKENIDLLNGDYSDSGFQEISYKHIWKRCIEVEKKKWWKGITSLSLGILASLLAIFWHAQTLTFATPQATIKNKSNSTTQVVKGEPGIRLKDTKGGSTQSKPKAKVEAKSNGETKTSTGKGNLKKEEVKKQSIGPDTKNELSPKKIQEEPKVEKKKKSEGGE